MEDYMTRNTKRLLLLTNLIALVVVASACEIELPVVDCSGINQPDMGGLVCFGMNMLALSAGAVAIIIALLLGIPR